MIAALYDIHANLPALEAVLDDIRQTGVERIVVGGDVFPGPMPRETLERLLRVDVRLDFIAGNGDRVVRLQMAGVDAPDVPDSYRDVIRWNAGQLRHDHERLLSSWRATLCVKTPLGDALFCHATPRNDSEIFTQATPEDRLRPVFEGVEVPLVVCGHTHMPFDRHVGAVRVVNAGSVGMPFCQPPGAYWLLIGRDVQFRRTAYDFDATAARMRATGCPQVEALCVRYVMQPPTEADTLELFASAELR